MNIPARDVAFGKLTSMVAAAKMLAR